MVCLCLSELISPGSIRLEPHVTTSKYARGSSHARLGSTRAESSRARGLLWKVLTSELFDYSPVLPKRGISLELKRIFVTQLPLKAWAHAQSFTYPLYSFSIVRLQQRRKARMVPNPIIEPTTIVPHTPTETNFSNTNTTKNAFQWYAKWGMHWSEHVTSFTWAPLLSCTDRSPKTPRFYPVFDTWNKCHTSREKEIRSYMTSAQCM